RPVPWPALLAAVAVPAALALATYPVRERLFTAVAGFAEGSALASAVASVADFGLLALVATAGVLDVWCWLRARRRFWLLAPGGGGDGTRGARGCGRGRVWARSQAIGGASPSSGWSSSGGPDVPSAPARVHTARGAGAARGRRIAPSWPQRGQRPAAPWSPV